MRVVRCLAVVVACLVGGCSSDTGDSDPAPSTSAAPASTVDPASRPQPIVDQIEVAIAALEAELGSPQRYFEVNATSRLVNIFVALNDGAVAQPWLYLDGELSSEEGSPAGGGTFAAADLDFDPELVLSKVLAELPGATIESFFVNGDGAGNVQYGVLATSAKGGGLDVQVGPTGEVLSVDPVN